MKIKVLIDVKTTLGEGPLWDVDHQRIYWIDSMDGRVFRATEKGTEVRCWDVQQKIGSMAIRKHGDSAILSLEDGFYSLDFKSGDIDLIANLESNKPHNRINDGKVDRKGRFFAGSMDTKEESASGSLYRLDADLKVTKIEDNIVCSNGPCFSPNDKLFYFADTWSGEISVYDFDINSGKIENKRTFTKIDTSNGGAADGSTVDSQGYLWNALVYDGKIIRYAPDGTIDKIINMPVKKVTSVNFGGPNMDILFVTSMAKPPLPRFPDDGVKRGSLFAIYDLGIEGIPEPRFGS